MRGAGQLFGPLTPDPSPPMISCIFSSCKKSSGARGDAIHALRGALNAFCRRINAFCCGIDAIRRESTGSQGIDALLGRINAVRGACELCIGT